MLARAADESRCEVGGAIVMAQLYDASGTFFFFFFFYTYIDANLNNSSFFLSFEKKNVSKGNLCESPQVIDRADGTYAIAFVCPTPGQHELHISLQAAPTAAAAAVGASPYTIVAN